MTVAAVTVALRSYIYDGPTDNDEKVASLKKLTQFDNKVLKQYGPI